MQKPLIRFARGGLTALREALLKDLDREHFAILLARRELAPDGLEIFVVQEAVLADDDDLLESSLARVRPGKEFVATALAMAQRDLQVNAIIDVHTHPFAREACFSGIDDADEMNFSQWLEETIGPGMAYASIVFSQEAWDARVWHGREAVPAAIRPASALETVPWQRPHPCRETAEMQARTALALGVDTVRRITDDQLIVLAGVGGLGSVMAEQLVRSGFGRIGLVDADTLETSNLNRFAGGFHEDLGRLKVNVVSGHLRRINPYVEVIAVPDTVESDKAQALMARADWIMLSTDSHSSRATVQAAALRYGVSLISAGVNITVDRSEGRHLLADQSGEVITLPFGIDLCLHCLGRIRHYVLAAETNPDQAVREGLVRKGYVQGIVEKEPAVMPLNSMIASIAVQTLLDQYRRDAAPAPVITVFESHNGFACHHDDASLQALPDFCAACGRNLLESGQADHAA